MVIYAVLRKITFRAKGTLSNVQSVNVLFNAEQNLLCKKSVYLSNPTNKQTFVDKQCEYLKNQGINVMKSDGDADVMIVKKATDLMEQNRKVVIVGDDTDLLVLALHMTRFV